MSFSFQFSRTPRICFGEGELLNIAGYASAYGKKVCLVAGRMSLKDSGRFSRLVKMMEEKDIGVVHVSVSGEPTTDIINNQVRRLSSEKINAVVAIGGGSVLDAGKAISAMLPLNEPVDDYLEIVGTRNHPGTKVTFIAVPTTAGTGSEATKNAVLTVSNGTGLKVSLRHDNFTPDIAVIDPELALSCPREITAACGMDALTQLIESWVSTKATPFTDSLAYDAIRKVFLNIKDVCCHKSGDIGTRSVMAYGALVSGITLANAGLGIVHGMAGVLGGLFPVPHGVACGTLLAPSVKTTIESCARQGNDIALDKFARIAFIPEKPVISDIKEACTALIDCLYELTDVLGMPRLGKYGVTESDIEKIAGKAGNKNNPAKLSIDEISSILGERI